MESKIDWDKVKTLYQAYVNENGTQNEKDRVSTIDRICSDRGENGSILIRYERDDEGWNWGFCNKEELEALQNGDEKQLAKAMGNRYMNNSNGFILRFCVPPRKLELAKLAINYWNEETPRFKAFNEKFGIKAVDIVKSEKNQYLNILDTDRENDLEILKTYYMNLFWNSLQDFNTVIKTILDQIVYQMQLNQEQIYENQLEIFDDQEFIFSIKSSNEEMPSLFETSFKQFKTVMTDDLKVLVQGIQEVLSKILPNLNLGEPDTECQF